eukprot:m.58287 g.58287  ORF g.58287 m.58287 type:complete len:319 (-) comp18990_c0_seq1:154-1110(-)
MQEGSVKQFLALCSGVFFFYLAYGYLQELIFLGGMKPFGWFITLVQFGFYLVFSKMTLLAQRTPRSGIPISAYAFLALLTVATMGLSNCSLLYVNYPTHVIFKSCKLVPVMFGSILIQKKVYSAVDWGATLFLSAGVLIFTLSDVNTSARFSWIGVAFLCTALAADAAIGNYQEKAMKQHHGSNAEMVFFSYGIGFCYIFAFCLLTGELFTAIQFVYERPRNLAYIFAFATTGFLGISFVLSLVKTFGALTAVTVTNCRKVATMILSFAIFPKPFSSGHIIGGFLVLAGIGLNVWSKEQKKKQQKQLQKAIQRDEQLV